MSGIDLTTSLESVSDSPFNKKTTDALAKLGLSTVGDLLEHYPRRYEDRRTFHQFPEGPMETAVCLHVEIIDTERKFGRKGRGSQFFEATVEAVGGDALGNRIGLRWFNQRYLHKVLLVGHRLVIYGQPKLSGRRLVIDHPDWEIIDHDIAEAEAHMGRLIPIYKATAGVNQKTLRELVWRSLSMIGDEAMPDWLPPGSAGDGQTRAAAIRAVHYPSESGEIEAARRYLALEEFTRLQMTLQQRRRERLDSGGLARPGNGELVDPFLSALPFAPTEAQRRVIREISTDLASGRPMIRLLQGDVGAGKTLVAAAAIFQALETGCDAALMAPTLILAEQHFLTFQEYCEPLGIEVRLVTSDREAGGDLPLFSGSRSGSHGSLTIGTHALLHGRGSFENGLGLVVIDEQHKFGVEQRQKLIDRGDRADLLVLTATPIPRTLTLAFYGDLDVSILDELPPGRGKLITGIRSTDQTDDAAAFLNQQLDEGRQGYLVYPLIDESDKLVASAATAEYEKWRTRLGQRRIALLTGKTSGEEKEETMSCFRDGEIDLLVSTTVIEVGVNVPNATVMLIYNAERFGLSQLHQLRGRIGRGEHKSYCVLMIPPENEEARARLQILVDTRDGFRIAEEDLRQRGPGEVLGTQQSGLPDMAFIEFLGDSLLVEQARKIASADSFDG